MIQRLPLSFCRNAAQNILSLFFPPIAKLKLKDQSAHTRWIVHAWDYYVRFPFDRALSVRLFKYEIAGEFTWICGGIFVDKNKMRWNKNQSRGWGSRFWKLMLWLVWGWENRGIGCLTVSLFTLFERMCSWPLVGIHVHAWKDEPRTAMWTSLDQLQEKLARASTTWLVPSPTLHLLHWIVSPSDRCRPTHITSEYLSDQSYLKNGVSPTAENDCFLGIMLLSCIGHESTFSFFFLLLYVLTRI